MMKKNKVNPERIIKAVEKIFNRVLSQHRLKTLGLVSIAIAKARRMSINEIAREMPTAVKRQKSKQTRLLRFLDKDFDMLSMTFVWTEFVLKEVYGKVCRPIMILIDKTKLIHGYESYVAGIPYRKRAIPIAFKVYSNQQIEDMQYLSENYIVWNFIDVLLDYIDKIFPGREVILIFDRGFSDEKLMRYIENFGGKYVIRVRKNVGIAVSDYIGKLSDFGNCGYFREVYYHFKEQIKVNLFISDTGEEPFYVVSNMDDCLNLLYRYRVQIEEGFRDMKSLFGFKDIVLKKSSQSRVEILLFLVMVTMGLLMLLYEKSGYRWLKYYNHGREKVYSIIRAIKEKIRDSWSNLRIEPNFTLNDLCFYDV